METALRAYRTEVVVPDDRVVVLHLPDDLPAGHALVIVQPLVHAHAGAAEDAGDDLDAALDPERADIEWWDEFEEHGA